MMVTSVPRVEFFINDYQLASGKFVQVLRDVFGNRAARWAHCAQGLWIECSPTKFVEFLIARDKAGINNAWKSLKVRRFNTQKQDTPAPAREIFDE